MITFTPATVEPPRGFSFLSKTNGQGSALGFDQVMQSQVEGIPALKSLKSSMTGDLKSDSADLRTALRTLEEPDHLKQAISIFLDKDNVTVAQEFRNQLSALRDKNDPLFDRIDRLNAAITELSKANVNYEDPKMRDAVDAQIKELQVEIQMIKDQIAEQTMNEIMEGVETDT